MTDYIDVVKEIARLQVANAQLTKERDELEAELFNEVGQLRESYNRSIAGLEIQRDAWASRFETSEARVKRYREMLEPDKLFILIAEFAYESDGGPDWIRKLADKISTLALAEPNETKVEREVS